MGWNQTGGRVANDPPVPGIDTPIPSNAWEAITAELRSAWETNPGELAAAGFVLGVRSPRKPGTQPESWEETAARVRRRGDDRRGNAAKKLLARARREGIWVGGDVGGAFTPRSKALLANVDRAIAATVAALAEFETIQLDRLLLGLNGVVPLPSWCGSDRFLDLTPPLRAISETAMDAAIDDLEAEGRVRRVFVTCSDCGLNHLALTRGARWTKGAERLSSFPRP